MSNNVVDLGKYREKILEQESSEEKEPFYVFTEEEEEELILALIEGIGEGGTLTEEQAHKFMTWAMETKVKASLLELILWKQVLPSFDDEGELVFSAKKGSDDE